jgi:hypothetical protein
MLGGVRRGCRGRIQARAAGSRYGRTRETRKSSWGQRAAAGKGRGPNESRHKRNERSGAYLQLRGLRQSLPQLSAIGLYIPTLLRTASHLQKIANRQLCTADDLAAVAFHADQDLDPVLSK